MYVMADSYLDSDDESIDFDPHNVDRVVFGPYEFKAWYGSHGYTAPYKLGPEAMKPSSISKDDSECKLGSGGDTDVGFPSLGESDQQSNDSQPEIIDKLYVCQWCFKYTIHGPYMKRHMKSCSHFKTPPGWLVYSTDSTRVYRVDGMIQKTYCQMLSLFAKLFLDSKSVNFSTEGFEFFVVCQESDRFPGSWQPMGFFSKEKLSWDDNNLACILVFPPFQRKGLGRFLIEYSYFVSRSESKVGSPEKPLSKFGKVSYYSYWCATVARFILNENKKKKISIDDITNATYIRQDDVITALEQMEALEKINTEDGKRYRLLKSQVNDWVIRTGTKLEPVIDYKCCYVLRYPESSLCPS